MNGTPGMEGDWSRFEYRVSGPPDGPAPGPDWELWRFAPHFWLWRRPRPPRPVYVVVLVRGEREDVPVDVGALRGDLLSGSQVDRAIREVRAARPSGTIVGSY